MATSSFIKGEAELIEFMEKKEKAYGLSIF